MSDVTATPTRAASLTSRFRVLGGQRSTLIKAAFAVALVAWPLLHKSDYALNVMTSAGLYALLTISVSLVIGQAGQLSFGHAAFYGIGAYTASLLVVRLHWASLPALLAGAAASVVVALIVGRPVLRLRYFYLALATIGLGQIALVVVTQFRGVTGGWNGLAPIPEFSLFGRTADSYISKYYLVWIVALAVLLFTQRALKFRTGRSLRALATSEIAASTLGVRTANWKLLAFAVSAVICGVAGGLFAFTTGAMTPDVFSFNSAVLPVIMMLLGGAETLWGGVLGAVVLTWLLNGFSSMAQYSGLIYAVVLVLLLLFLPNGVVQGLSAARRSRLAAWLGRRRRPSAADVGTDQASGLFPSVDGEPGLSLAPADLLVEPDAAAAGGSVLLADLAKQRRAKSDQPLLVVDDVSVDFGGVRAVNRVSLSVEEGKITALIGPNGAGKTTLFNVISHLQRPSTGRVTFMGTASTKLPPSETARLGMARTFQNLRIFPNLSALENVQVGCHRHEKSGMVADGLGLPSQRREERRSVARALDALALVGLDGHADKPAASLPYGQQRLVEIARALASEPRLLLLDEPAAGMNAAERAYLVERIAHIRDAGVTVLLVEHDIELVMGISDKVMVLDLGMLIASGKPEEVRQDKAVIEAYLGVGRDTVDEASPRARTARSQQPPLLSIQGLSTSYGPIRALSGVSFDVPKGETVVVLGANGAGKSTLLRTVSGVLRPTAGRILYRGEDIAHHPAAAITSAGICQVPEGRQLFPSLSVEDNLLLGSSGRRHRKDVGDDLAFVYELFPALAERRKQSAGSLSGGQQQMAAIGRALTGRPSLLLLDEPSMGLAPLLVEHIFETLKKLNEQGLTILMVEQNAELALHMADYAVVLQTGNVTLAGPADELRRDDRVRESYLGSVVSSPLTSDSRGQDE